MDILQREHPVSRQGALLCQFQQKPGRCVTEPQIPVIAFRLGDMVVLLDNAVDDCKFNHSRFTFVGWYVGIDQLLSGFLLPFQPHRPKHPLLFQQEPQFVQRAVVETHDTVRCGVLVQVCQFFNGSTADNSFLISQTAATALS